MSAQDETVKVITNRALTAAAGFRDRPMQGYLLAIGSFVVALALRFAVDPILPGGFPYLTFFPAVLITAFLGGRNPAILCAAACVFAAWYWFIAPFHTFGLDLQSTVAVLFFVVILAVDITVIELMFNALGRVHAERLRADALAERQKTLFQELQHRTANNMSFISAIIGMHKRRASDEPRIVAALDDARLRLDTMARVHRRLYDPASTDLPLEDYFEGLGLDMLDAAGRPDIALSVTAVPERIDMRRLLTLSLVIIEVMTNALKHAFPEGRPGTIAIRLENEDADNLALTIRDDGPGMPEGFDTAESTRLGFRILKNFATSLEGAMTWTNDGGTVARLVFPRLAAPGTPAI